MRALHTNTIDRMDGSISDHPSQWSFDMNIFTRSNSVRAATYGILAALVCYVAQPAFAQPARADRAEDRIDWREDYRDRSVNRGAIDRAEDRVDTRENRVDRNTGPARPAAYTAPGYTAPAYRRVVAAPTRVVVYPTVVAPRARYYGAVRIYRPYGPAYYGYGFYFTDDDAWKWLSFTAITIKLIDELSEAQARKHEQAQIEATTAATGDTIFWEEDDASGSVTVVRQGRNTSGQQCREYHQNVTIGGETESAYGTACLQEDGSWKIVA